MFKFIAAAIALAAAPAVSATQLILTPGNVVGASGYYNLCCSFQPGNILDQQTGTVTEGFGDGYWLNPDNGPFNAYITIDLGAVYALTGITLYNTHNGPYADRGTGNFEILGSNTVYDTGGGNFDVVAGSSLLSAVLNPETSGNPAAQHFTLSGSARYIRFTPETVSVGGISCCGANNYGLNELRIFATVPEPATWGLMIAGFGLVGTGLRRRAPLVA